MNTTREDCEIKILHEGRFIDVRVHRDYPRLGWIIGDEDDGPTLELSTAETEEAMGLMGIRPLGWCDVEDEYPRARPI